MSQLSKIYCPECGQPNQYLGNKPKFCMSCGNGFTVEAKTIKAAKAQSQVVEEENVESEEEETGGELPNITKLEVENASSFRPERQMLTHIASTVSDSQSQVPERPGENLSNKKILEQFRNEAGTSRKK